MLMRHKQIEEDVLLVIDVSLIDHDGSLTSPLAIILQEWIDASLVAAALMLNSLCFLTCAFLVHGDLSRTP